MIYIDYKDVKLNTLVWACAYSTNDTEKSMALKKKPVLGKLMGTGYGCSTQFYEVNKKGEIKKSGSVYPYSRQYADTAQECIQLYNRLVMNQINFLKNLITDCEGDFIK